MEIVSSLLLIKYTLTNAYKFRDELFDIIEKAVNNRLQLVDLKADFLISDNTIKVLILDFDGVLSTHGKNRPSVPVVKWLEDVIKLVEQERIFILTNAVTYKRKSYFSDHYPSIHFVEGVRRKPYPDGILKILDITKCKPDEAIIIDDRILTGILAGLISGVRTIYISKPLIDVTANFVNEIFFMGLRIIEKILIRIMVKIK